MRSWLRRFGAAGVWFTLCIGIAQAHPLGNFTINHLAQVTPSRGSLNVRYTLDIAEIPTFQIVRGAGTWNAAQLATWAAMEATLVESGLIVSIDGHVAPLTSHGATARFRPGAGGLPTLYWEGDFSVPVDPRAARSIRIEDRVYADRRIGWKDVVVAPQTEPTHELTAYPSALIGSPRRNDVAEFMLMPNGRARNVAVRGGDDFAPAGTSAFVRSGYLSDLFARPDQSGWVIALTILVAFGLGALHGLEPGHGKTLLAFTLVGARATVKQAGILALSLTFAHTVAVLLLGLALFFIADFASEAVFGWMALVSGAAVAFVGARSLNSAIAHANHAHEHAGKIAGDAPLKFSSAVIAAMSGGIAPCPAAIVVLLTALHLHRVGYGVALIVVFSLGLATILTALGVGVVHGAAWIRKQGSFEHLMRFAPVVTASIISLVGAVMLAQAFAQQGVGVPVPLVVVLTLAAIGGYALVPKHSHGGDAEGSAQSV